MNKILKSIFEIDNTSLYNEDYYYKIKGILKYKDTDDNYNQFELTEFLEFFKNNGLIDYINNKLEEVKTDYLYSSATHGINHNIRVMLYSVFIAHKLGLKNDDIEILVDASLYHDTGRINDKEESAHGQRSAYNIDKLVSKDYKDINILKAIIEIHSIDDDNFDTIIKKYKIKDINRFKILYSILKDSDALDRVRLSYYSSEYSGLNLQMLRIPISFNILKCAHQLNEFFIKNSEKQNIILDTDVENEVDDKFALTYLLNNLWRFNLEAITIAPFYGSKYSIIKDNNISNIYLGIEASYNTALNMMDMIGVDYKEKVFKGSTGTLSNGYNEKNDAVDKIIEICLKNDNTNILCIGALTNVALAIRKNPNIISRANIIWLGGNDFMYGKNDEFNFRQDIQAVREVFASGMNLTLIPCVNVASVLITTGSELKEYIYEKGEIGKYLYNEYCRCKPEKLGKSKTLWDLSVIAYLINKNWFEVREIERPDISENGEYTFNNNTHKINVVTKISRDHIFRDFFGKISTIEYKKEYEKDSKKDVNIKALSKDKL